MQVTPLCEYPVEDTVCSVAWDRSGAYLSVGTLNGVVDIWDVSSLTLCGASKLLHACASDSSLVCTILSSGCSKCSLVSI